MPRILLSVPIRAIRGYLFVLWSWFHFEHAWRRVTALELTTMKAQKFSDAYWTARFAPYVLAAAAFGLVISLFWSRPPFSYFPVAVLSGAAVFFFHVLRWRTSREGFQLAAMASGFIPLFVVLSRLHGAQKFQYLAVFILSYAAAVVIFRRRVLES